MSSGDIHITLFPASHWPLAKSFWQHTGTGISSRFAEHCLRLLNQPHPDDQKQKPKKHAQPPHGRKELDNTDNATPPKSPIHGRNRHYHKCHTRTTSFPPSTHHPLSNGETVTAEEEIATIGYLEQRYARNLHQNAAPAAKRSLRRRIAGVLVREGSCSNGGSPTTPTFNGECDNTVAVPSTRGVPNITEDDVFLFPGGMCAIWHTHQLLLNALGSRKSVCWG